jgi:hypothetical protein
MPDFPQAPDPQSHQVPQAVQVPGPPVPPKSVVNAVRLPARRPVGRLPRDYMDTRVNTAIAT